MKTGKRIVPVIIVLASVLLFQTLAWASQTHVTSGSGGQEAPDTHYLNPAHIILTVGADHSGNVTSGGREHDYNSTTQQWYLPHSGDWAMDINLLGSSSLYVDYGGYYADQYSVGVDHSKNIRIYAEAKATATTGGAACYYQQYDIKVDFTDRSGIEHKGSTAGFIGTIWVNHLSFSRPSGGTIETPSATWTTEAGGVVQRLWGASIGSVYNGTGACSGGAHSHLEFLSKHVKGMALEWHSKDSPPGPDAYMSMPPVTNHVHQGTGTYEDSGDSVTATQTVGNLGGASTSFWMQDNPYSDNH
ncbi:MAG: hypothetical protein ACM3XM_11000 [Mycobacterium leprae]